MTLTVLQLLYVIAVDTSLVVSFTFTNETKRRKISLSVPETSLTTTWDGEEEGEEFKEEDKSEEEDKGVKREEKRGRKKDKKYKKRREWHFTEMDHQIRTASQAYSAKIGAAFRYVWAPEEFNTVHGPNFNPDWITWKERELPGPSVKMKKTEVDFVKVKKEEKKWSCWAPLEATCHENPPKS